MKGTLKLLVLFLVTSSLQAASITDEINSSENGLRSIVHFTHDPLWNIEERMEYHRVPGVSIAVIEDFRVRWAKSYGVAEVSTGDLITPDTLFQAASISKPIASYAALKLVSESQLELESIVNEHLSSWKIPDNENTKTSPVRLKHLLSHSAGFNVHGFPGYSFGKKLPTVTQILDGLSPAITSPVTVGFEPGTNFRYSGGGYTVLQTLIADVSKSSYQDFVGKNIFLPLDMQQSIFLPELKNHKKPKLASGHAKDGSLINGKYRIYPELAAAGMWTTPTEVAYFMIDIQKSYTSDSGKILKKNLVNKLLSLSVKKEMGLGLYLMDKEGEEYFLHEGTNNGFESLMIAHKSKGYGVVVMTNANNKTFINELRNSVAAQYKWDKFIPKPYVSLPITKSEQDRIGGRYKFQPDSSMEISFEDNKAFLKMPKMPVLALYKVGNNEYIHKQSDQKISFIENDKTGFLEYVIPMRNGKLFGRPKLAVGQHLPLDLVLMGDVHGAEKSYKAFIEKTPKFSRMSEMELLKTINVDIKEKRANLVLPLLSMATRLYSDSNKSWVELISYYENIGDIVGAKLACKSALEFLPRDQKILDKLIEIESKLDS